MGVVRTRRHAQLWTAVVVAVLALATLALPASAAVGDVGHADQLYTGVSNPPTSDKPQSKLWYNDGSWWADMFAASSHTWHIFRLDRQTETWVDTGTQVDDRPQSLADTLWDGSHLYVASQYASVSTSTSVRASVSGRPARLYRYSYDATAQTYTLDAGFPVNINNNSSESLTLDKDSTGTLWATWTQVSGSTTAGFTSAVYVNSTNGSDLLWGTPSVLPVVGATTAPDDISAVVAFGRNRIGILWSNHIDDTVYWAVHNDGDAAATWRASVANRGQKQADDHLNIKTVQADPAGRVFAAVKTSLDELATSTSASPQVNLLVFKPGTGSWSSTTFGTLADCHTRPQVVLDEENSTVHMFATAPSASGCAFSGAPGSIYEKVAPMDNPVFPAGRGTPVIRDAASANMNNVTSSKQSVSSRTGLVVLAGNSATAQYWHADIALPVKLPAPPTSSFTASATSGVAPMTVQFTDTSSGGPTSWTWDLGDGTQATTQNPSATYTTPGTYAVTLVAANAGGSGPPATQSITVTAPAPAAGIARAATATALTTTAGPGLTLPTPEGTSAGDVLVSCLALNGGAVAGTGVPSGWSPIASVTSIANPRVYGYYRVAGAAEPTGYRWGFSSSVTSAGGIARYTGAAGVDGPASQASGASSTTGTVPGVTTTTASAMLVGCMGVNSGSTAVTISSPAELTKAWDLGGKRHAFADGVRSTAGPGSPETWSFSAGREWAGWSVALRPL